MLTLALYEPLIKPLMGVPPGFWLMLALSTKM
jgi:hypothetical protein